MADRPIIFSAPMIRALLEGRKTQTRRVLPEQRHVATPAMVGGRWQWKSFAGATLGDVVLRFSPGDRLWVREAWKPGAWRDDGRVALDYLASPELTQTPWVTLPETADWAEIWPRWTDEVSAAGSVADADGMHHWEPGQSPLRWRSPIHMPRWASRLTLTVTDVRVQRLQDISVLDIGAEGIPLPPADAVPPSSYYQDVMRDGYRALWNNLHGPEAWDANPWVAALTFTVRQGNIDA